MIEEDLFQEDNLNLMTNLMLDVLPVTLRVTLLKSVHTTPRLDTMPMQQNSVKVKVKKIMKNLLLPGRDLRVPRKKRLRGSSSLFQLYKVPVLQALGLLTVVLLST